MLDPDAVKSKDGTDQVLLLDKDATANDGNADGSHSGIRRKGW